MSDYRNNPWKFLRPAHIQSNNLGAWVSRIKKFTCQHTGQFYIVREECLPSDKFIKTVSLNWFP